MKLLSILILIACSTTAPLRADVSQHVVKLNKTSENHRMENIDFIYVINLDERPEKLKKTLDQLTPYSIYPYRFSAVNGWKLSLEEINDVGLKFSPEMDGGFMATSYLPNNHFLPTHELIQTYGQTYFCHCTARGTIGIALSHLSILQDAYDSGYETIWVMEDDIEVIRHPKILSSLIDELDTLVGKDNWDILFTDRDIRNKEGEYVPAASAARRPDFVSSNDFVTRTTIGSNLCKIGSRYGAHSMIVRRSGMKKILQFLTAHQIFLPYDMEFTLPPGIKLYSVLEDVVSNLTKALSDNGGPNYSQTVSDSSIPTKE